MRSLKKNSTFWPFGYAFEIKTPMSPDQVKFKIREGLKPWFELRDGPRGFVLGPIIWLWLEYTPRGPSLIALIDRESGETRVRGRAGFNIAAAFGLAGCVIGYAALIIFHPDYRASTRAIFGFTCFTIFSVLIIWSLHHLRNDANPLFRYLERRLGIRSTWFLADMDIDQLALEPETDASFIVNGDVLQSKPNPQLLARTLKDLQSGDFAIIEFGPDHYMQTMLLHDRFVLEKRVGGPESHYRATREVEIDEVFEAMNGFLTKGVDLGKTEWERVVQ